MANQKLDALEQNLALVHADDKTGDELRRNADHAHVMSHHGLEMDTPEAHEAAASAHEKVADMHREYAKACDDDGDEDDKPAKKGKK